MSKNIKDIGKELMGKSLNSFHRKTGLTQLEKNNEIQDGILDGILSQVDDAYIEKTEQSNVIHLDGSGDGVVILDSVEGNTMVNIIPNGRFKNNKQHWLGGDYFTTFTENDEVVGVKMNGVVEGHHIRTDFLPMKQNTEYTLIYSMKNTSTNNSIWTGVYYIDEFGVQKYLTTDNYDRNNYSSYVQKKIRFTTLQGSHFDLRFYNYCNGDDSNILYIKDVMILEGDWTNKEIPPYFEGLQSSFEEKANDEGKYEIEILLNNKNLLNFDNVVMDNLITEYKVDKNTNSIVYKKASTNANNGFVGVWVNVKPNTNYKLSYDKINGGNIWVYTDEFFGNSIVQGGVQPTFNSENNSKLLIGFYTHTDGNIVNEYRNVMLRENNTNSNFILPKQNKIKLSINEPLRAINDRKDNICIKDGRLMVERNCIELVYNGTENWEKQSVIDSNCTSFYSPTTDKDIVTLQKILCNILPYKDSTTGGASGGKIFVYTSKNLNVIIEKNKLSSDSVEGFKEYLKTNNLKVVIPLNTPIYEEVLNEHGEPILLEGYENGTIYIDSAIVPTTTVKYTPKMESFKTYKEVKVRNAINDFDVTENVIPYMMEVDMKLTELEISAFSTYNIKNIRKMEVLDMTSMQERTFKMLERLIRGKSHTKQELVDRVLLYEQAKRITTEQALELNLIIEEVYGA